MTININDEYKAEILLSHYFHHGHYETESKVSAMFVKGLLQRAGIPSCTMTNKGVYTLSVSPSIGLFLDILSESMKIYD